VTIQNGNANEGNGIENRGTLRLRNVAGEDGAGIRNSGRLTMSGSIIADNRAETRGGILNRGELALVDAVGSSMPAT
jgi:hypothetical protein